MTTSFQADRILVKLVEVEKNESCGLVDTGLNRYELVRMASWEHITDANFVRSLQSAADPLALEYLFGKREQKTGYVRSFIGCLSDADAQCYLRAAIAVGQFGAASEHALPLLAALLNASEYPDNFLSVTAYESRQIQFAPFAACHGVSLGAVMRAMAAHALAGLPRLDEDTVALLTAALDDRHACVRGNAAYALGSSGPAATFAVDALEAALLDAEDGVVCDAAQALASIGRPAAHVVEKLIQLCDYEVELDSAWSPAGDKRGYLSPFEHAMMALAPRVLDHLVDLASYEEEPYAGWGLRFLQEAHPPGISKRTWTTLFNAFGRNYPRYSEQFATYMAEGKAHEAIDLLDDVLTYASLSEDAKSLTLYSAAASLIAEFAYAGICNGADVGQFVELDWLRREKEVQLVTAEQRAYALLLSRQALPFSGLDLARVAELLSDSSILLRILARDTVLWAAISHPDAPAEFVRRIPGLIDDLGSEYVVTVVEQVRDILDRALRNAEGVHKEAVLADCYAASAEVSGEAVNALLEAMSSEYPKLSLWARDRLHRFGFSIIPELLTALTSSSAMVRSNSAKMIGHLGYADPACLNIMLTLLDDVDPSVRCNASLALRHFKHEAAFVVPSLAKRLSDEPEVASRAAYALGVIGQASLRAIPSLIGALSRDDTVLRFHVSEALRAINPDSLADSHDPGERLVLSWFEQVTTAEWLESLQVFWCVGRLQEESLFNCDKAIGLKRVDKILTTMKLNRHLADLPVSQSKVRSILWDLESFFNAPPFAREAWTEAEAGPDFRAEHWRGARRESRWTARARRAWLYTDTFLRITGQRPLMILAPSDGELPRMDMKAPE